MGLNILKLAAFFYAVKADAQRYTGSAPVNPYGFSSMISEKCLQLSGPHEGRLPDSNQFASCMVTALSDLWAQEYPYDHSLQEAEQVAREVGLLEAAHTHHLLESYSTSRQGSAPDADGSSAEEQLVNAILGRP